MITTASTFLIDSLIPANQITLLAGASGAGKTTLIMQILSAVQQNQLVFGYPARPDLRVGYLAADRTWDDYVLLSQRIGLDLSNIAIQTLIDDTTIDMKRFEDAPMDTLKSILTRMLPRDLIICDPFVFFLGVHPNNWQGVGSRMVQVSRWCKEHNVAILGTHHATKARTDFGFLRPQDRISGSSALHGFTATQMFLDTPEESQKLFFEWHIVSRHAPQLTIQLQRTSTGAFELSTDLSPAQVILHAFPNTGECISRKQLLTRVANISPRTLDRWLPQLAADGVLVREDLGQYRLATTGLNTQ